MVEVDLDDHVDADDAATATGRASVKCSVLWLKALKPLLVGLGDLLAFELDDTGGTLRSTPYRTVRELLDDVEIVFVFQDETAIANGSFV